MFRFEKSSYSNPTGECVEVALNLPGVVAIRDSKNSAGTVLCLAPAAWAAFTATVRNL
ncbi:DUF397 domain-containing protein [Streptomyces sp. NPDC095613]|uniref:DUF397 domain-containing protein n=1 Tax=Streptomyces sp. NPDC095613 TaxID=3155540 RepID=UPI0033271C04